MQCKICALSNSNLIDDIERALLETKGALLNSAKERLKEQYPQYADEIQKITDQDCRIHFNFHQRITRAARALPTAEEQAVLDDADARGIKSDSAGTGSKRNTATLAGDIGKDEAEVLYELLNSQAATFNALTARINEAITECEHDMNVLVIHPETINFYNALTQSMRLTVRELRDLDVAKNGEKDGAAEGLKALAMMLAPNSNSNNANPGATSTSSISEDEMTTKEFDD